MRNQAMQDATFDAGQIMSDAICAAAVNLGWKLPDYLASKPEPKRAASASTTIRRNSLKKIESILRGAVLIREFRYDDMGDTLGTATPEHVLDVMRKLEASRVYLDGAGSLHVAIHGNWHFTAYPSREVAKGQLTDVAFKKYFGEA